MGLYTLYLWLSHLRPEWYPTGLRGLAFTVQSIVTIAPPFLERRPDCSVLLHVCREAGVPAVQPTSSGFLGLLSDFACWLSGVVPGFAYEAPTSPFLVGLMLNLVIRANSPLLRLPYGFPLSHQSLTCE
jgi:hypothetical protein